MKKIVVFGATGRTGLEVIKQALKNGHEVTAIVRNPDRLNGSHPFLKIVKGDVFKPSTYSEELVGKTAVIYCIGNAAKVYSEGIKNVIATMDNTKVKRLLCVASIMANKEVGVVMFVMMKLSEFMFRGLHKDMLLMETIVKDSNTNWTVIRPTMLTHGPYTGKYRTAENEHIKNPWTISRADVADLLLKSIEDPNAYKAIIEVAY